MTETLINMTGKSPLLTLNNNIKMPALGLGVYQSTPAQTKDAVVSAIGNGYRLIDTAAAYFNERQVGEGIRRSGINRTEIFVTTKLWMSDYGEDRTLRAFGVSLRKLGLEYVDLYLLHWPVPSDFDMTVASYRAAEKLFDDGLVRAIGVCNFSPRHLEALIHRVHVVPAVNQVELHPFFIQQELRDVHKRLGTVTQAWSPLGGVNVYSSTNPTAVRNPLEHPVVMKLAVKHGKTSAQIVLRWHMEHGLSAIPKSVQPQRIAENIDIFDFTLSPEELASLDALDTGVRGGPNPDTVTPQVFPLKIDD